MNNKIRLKLVFIFILMICYSPLFSQQSDFIFKNFTVEDGLSNSSPTHIVQDEKGFLWIATLDGLNKFDGYNFTKYESLKNNINGLFSNTILWLFIDKKNNLFICTSLGLNLYNKDSDSFSSYDEFKNIYITGINDDAEGNYWVATNGKGLFRLNSNMKTQHIYLPNDNGVNCISSKRINVLFIDSEEIIWIGTFDHGVDAFNPKTNKFENFSISSFDNKKLSNNYIQGFYEDRENNIWVATSFGISKINKKTNTVFNYSDKNDGSEKIISTSIFSFFEDKNNILWITGNNGLLKYNAISDSFVNPQIKNQNFLLQNDKGLRYAFVDKQHNVWICTHNSGLKLIESQNNDFNHNKKGYTVNSIYEDKVGHLWFGMNGDGLHYLDRENNISKTYEYSGKKTDIGGKAIFAINEDSKGNIIVGGYNSGISILNNDKKTFTNFKHDPNNSNSLSFDDVRDIKEDSKGNLWIATNGGGLDKFDIKKGEFTHFKYDDFNSQSISTDWVLCIYEDTKQNLWIGTYFGLNKFNSETNVFVKYFFKETNPNSLAHNWVYSIFEDSENQMWIGTGGGLSNLNCETDSFTNYTKTNGLSSNVINGILEDNNKNLWISTNKGISKFSLSQKTFKNYDVRDGLQANEFIHGAYLKTKSGEMLFGGIQGYNLFYPEKIKVNQYVPEIVITGFNIFDKPVKFNIKSSILKKHISQTKHITISYKESVFSFEFVALSFVIPERNKYAYMMEGFDENWRYTSSLDRKAIYTNLDPGDYIFRVKGANNDGVWNEKGTSITLTIIPPWWQTLWFRVLLIATILLIVISFYFWKVNSLRKGQRILEQKVIERTTQLQDANADLEERQEEINQQNEEILSQSCVLKQTNLQLKGQNDKIEKSYKNSKTLSEFGQKLTATLNINNLGSMLNEYISSLMLVSAFGIGIYNKNKNCIEYIHFIEHNKRIPFFSESINSTNSLTVWCFKNQKPVLITDLESEYSLYIDQIPEFSTKEAPNSVIYLPLSVEKKRIGVLTVCSYTKNSYTENELTNLQTVASYLAIALDNASAYKIIDAKNQHIEGSIRYAQTIQNAILPPKAEIAKYFENFILFRPKDIVSGDFYWMSSVGNSQSEVGDLSSGDSIFIAAVDCTGHGVPGAFMSMIGSRLLDEIVEKEKIYDTGQILTRLDVLVQKALRQDKTANDDGMDLCLVRIKKEGLSYQVTFSGAKRPLIYFDRKNQKLIKINGNIKTVGGLYTNKLEFSHTEISMQKDDILYLTSDGYTDQNNKIRRSFGSKNFIKLLNKNVKLSMQEQGNKLVEALDKYKESELQRDDITVIGIKI